jgi:hypothetical protein
MSPERKIGFGARPRIYLAPVEARAGQPQTPYLRVFEIVRASESDKGIGFFEVDLPTRWARSHEHAEVALSEDERFGWRATLVGDGNQYLIGFPWYDHVDQMLVDSEGELPPDIASGSWSDIEQGWWGSILVDGGDVYLAEADFGALFDVTDPADRVLVRPGVVAVGGVEVLWNRVPRAVYEAAWDEAINRFLPASGWATRATSPGPAFGNVTHPSAGRVRGVRIMLRGDRGMPAAQTSSARSEGCREWSAVALALAPRVVLPAFVHD